MLGVRTLPGRVLKRLLDIVVAVLALVVAAPVLVVLAILIKVDGPGPVLFRQERVGRDGRIFRIWKLRTMSEVPGASAPDVTVAADPRVTSVGRWLRRWKLDELPQFINVLDGSMSLVGPRPEVPRYVALYTDEERAVLMHRPGLTDPATIAFRHEEQMLAGVEDWERYYRDVLMREKLARNLEYLRDATVLTDVGVLVRTAAALLSAAPGTGV